MKNKLSILVLILSLLTSSCSNNVESQNPQSQSDSKVKPASATSESKLYKINWSYCADHGQILSAQEDGCVRNSEPLYFWLEEPDVIPKAILIRRGVPMSLTTHIKYQVGILAQGCFPKHTEIQPLDFYSVWRSFSIDKNLVGDRQIIEDVPLEVEPVSREEANEILVFYTVRPNRYPPGCPSLAAEREKLAPYFPKGVKTSLN